MKPIIYFYIILVLCMSCKEKESNNKSINYNRTEIASCESYFKEVKYVKKDIVNQKNIFEYKDFKVSIEYGRNSLIGFSQNNSMNYYKFNYDLDSGDLDLLRFKGKDGDLFIVELDDHYLRFYNIYYVIKDNVFYLGNIDTDLSKIIEDNPNLKLKFQISKKDNKIEIQLLLEDKKFYLKSFVMNNALQSVSFKDKTSNYNKDWLGEYEITPFIISQHNEEKLEVKYNISIESYTELMLSIDSDFAEDGFYAGELTIKEENNILHAEGKYISNGIDDFYLKKDNDKYFIKSKRFINQDWQELKKIK